MGASTKKIDMDLATGCIVPRGGCQSGCMSGYGCLGWFLFFLFIGALFGR